MSSLPALAPKDELQFLLKGVEEASKHARTILFALATSSAFVLIAAVSRSSSSTIALPIAGNAIPQEQFFFWSPLVILFTYLYLQIYVVELRGRVSRLAAYQARFDPPLSTLSQDLLFPWFFVLALEARRRKKMRDRASWIEFAAFDADSSLEVPLRLLFPMAVLIVWLMGPIVLATLLLVFLREQNAVALVPCVSFLVASGVAIACTRPQRSRLESSIWVLLAGSLVLFTLASVPALRDRTYLTLLWEFRTPLRDAFLWSLPTLTKVIAVAVPTVVAFTLARLVYARFAPIQLYRARFVRELGGVYPEIQRSYYPLKLKSEARPDDLDAISALLNVKRALILGPVGSGKSTLLYSLALRFATTRVEGSHLLPVVLPLRRISQSPVDLTQMAMSAMAVLSVDLVAKFWTLARQGQLVFLIDGLDEIAPAFRREVIDAIKSLVATLPACRVYLTARSNDDAGDLATIVDEVFTLSPLQQDGLERFLQAMGLSSDGVQVLIQQLMQSDYSTIASNPLWLTLLASLFKNTGTLPTSDEDAVRAMVQHLLARAATPSRGRDMFSVSAKTALLSLVAREMNARDRSALPRSDVLDLTRRTGHPGFEQDLVGNLLDSGLLVQDGNLLRFSHRIFQDYFAGQQTEAG